MEIRNVVLWIIGHEAAEVEANVTETSVGVCGEAAFSTTGVDGLCCGGGGGGGGVAEGRGQRASFGEVCQGLTLWTSLDHFLRPLYWSVLGVNHDRLYAPGAGGGAGGHVGGAGLTEGFEASTEQIATAALVNLSNGLG